MANFRWKRVCVTSGCGAWQVRSSRCEKCAQEYEKNRGTRQQRGYGAQHDRVRAHLLGQLRVNEMRGVVFLCWRCNEPMTSDQELDADHSTTLASAGGVADCLTHAACNRGKRVPS